MVRRPTEMRLGLAGIAGLTLAAGLYGQVPLSISLSVNPSATALLGSPVTLTATVQCFSCASAFSGVVGFYDNGVFVGDASFGNQTASSASVSITTTLLGAGAHSLRATYNGSVSKTGNVTSSPVTFVIQSVGASTFNPAPNPNAHTTPTSIAAGDFNGDGIPDFAVANSGSGDVSVLMGNGDGSFKTAVTYPTGAQPMSVVVADFNSDGRPDLAVGNAGSDTITILLGNGDGTFRAAAPLAGADASMRNLAVGDFNRDGLPDLAVQYISAALVEIRLGLGNGTFQQGLLTRLDPSAIGLTIGDLNGDGISDLVIPNGASESVSVFLAAGDGTFQQPVTYPIPITPVARPLPQAIGIGDFNGDGRPDLAVAGSGVYSILLGAGQGLFQGARNYTNQAGGAVIRTGDFNGDGKLDLALVQAAGSNVDLLLGNGDGTFQVAFSPNLVGSVSRPGGLAVLDLNSDAIDDLVATNGATNNLTVLLGATFAAGSISAAAGTPQSTQINTAFPVALAAKVQDSFGNPLAGAKVVFAAPTTGPSGTFAGAASATITTDATGVATAPTFIANGTAGSYTVMATVSGVNAPAVFSLTNVQTSGAAASIRAIAGTPQSAPINTIFGTALQATVLDANAKPVSGALVTFTAPSSGPGGSFVGGIAATSSVTVLADANGVATAPNFRANSAVGSYTVIATVPGASSAASFSLTNQAASTATLTVTPNQLSFVAYPGLPPSPQAIAVQTSGTAVPFTVSVSGGSWLKVDSSGGTAPAVVHVSIDPTGLAPNTYSGSIAITPSGSSISAPAASTVIVTLTVPQPATVVVAPSNDLTFSVFPGAAPFSQVLAIASTNGATLPFAVSISGSPRFVTPSPANGNTPALVTLTIDPSSLTTGVYSASVAVLDMARVTPPVYTPGANPALLIDTFTVAVLFVLVIPEAGETANQSIGEPASLSGPV